jgi:hypothetical protein
MFEVKGEADPAGRVGQAMKEQASWEEQGKLQVELIRSA